MVVKVFVVDDSAVVRQALAHILAGNPDVELIGSAPNPLLAMAAIRKNPPDVLLLLSLIHIWHGHQDESRGR